jgi:hypothetical protein
MADDLRQTFDPGEGSERGPRDDGVAESAETIRVRRAALKALERELSEFFNDKPH